MQKFHSSEGDNLSATPEIHRILWKPKFSYRVRMSLALSASRIKLMRPQKINIFYST